MSGTAGGDDPRTVPPGAGSGRWRSVLAVLFGALLLVWPAALNGYPLVFIDTASYLFQTVVPTMTWDKPWVYGPLIHLAHGRLSLWGAMLAQGALLSHLLWLAGGAVLGRRSARAHLLTCLGLAALTSLPWFAATLMPDALTGAVVLCVFLLGLGWDGLGRGERFWVLGAGVGAVAVHASHLPTAAALAVFCGAWAWRGAALGRAAVPALGAAALLLLTNAVGHGRAALSPHGATFVLARLLEDGPAAATLRARCPAAGWVLCGAVDVLDAAVPVDSDWFLWSPDSPLNLDPATGAERVMGGAVLAPEAGMIVAAALRDRPGAVLWGSLRNGATQLFRARVGDTLGDEHLDASARVWIGRGFPAAELRRYDAGLQARGALPAAAAPALVPHVPVLWLSLPLALWAAWRARQRGAPRAVPGFVLCVLLGLATNALVTGALSKPHHRYQARIVWLLPLAAGWGLVRAERARRPAWTPNAGPQRA